MNFPADYLHFSLFLIFKVNIKIKIQLKINVNINV